jgi:proline iminopeptidase
MYMVYPPIAPNAEYQLPVDSMHTLYVEESGNPHGIPIVVLHGGPGAGSNPAQREFFDPEVYRIVMFDQRGAGRSTPHAELTNNTTAHLVSDIEMIRKFLKIDQWVVFGGSWGATLALVYAQTHPEAVLGLIVRGVFLGREQDLRWFFQEGASYIFPDHWEAFYALIPENERHNLVSAYYSRLTGDDDLARMTAAKAWSSWEGQCLSLQPSPKSIDDFTEPFFAISLARIECHYFVNHCFLKPNQILKKMDKIRDLPVIIVHGRYDMVCTLDNAWLLHQAWPGSELNIVRDAGHSSREPGITSALVEATQNIAKRLKINH